MAQRRLLLPFDFSLSGYAAHYAVTRMYVPQRLEIVLLAAGFRRRFPAPRSLHSFVDQLAAAHRARGCTVSVQYVNRHPRDVVQQMLARERFSLVVVGSELAACLNRSDQVEWVVIEPAGGERARREVWPKTPATCSISSELSAGLV